MFTKEKVIDNDIIISTLNFINNESDVMFKSETMMYATNHYLTFDECCYILEHINLINSTDYRQELIDFINEWNVIISEINKSLDNNTICDYLSNFKGIRVIPGILGLTREGIELTDKGSKLLSEINKQIQIEDKKLDNLAISKGFMNYKHLLKESFKPKRRTLGK